MVSFNKFDSIDPIEYYKAVNTETSLEQGVWNVNTSKRHAFKIFSDIDVLDEHDEKILVPAVNQQTLSVVRFSDQINKVFRDTKIVTDNFGDESVVLTLGDRVITVIIDQSGSMTWNDNNKFRHTLAREIVEKIDENYPGKVTYNILDYGGTLVDLLFFGIIDDDTVDVNDLDTLTKLLFADKDANFAGVRVIRNPDRFPVSVVDGEEVADGLFSKVFDDELEENEIYYYTVFTFDENLRFSQGVNIKVTPRKREIPRGVTSFRSWVPSSGITTGDFFKGSGVIRDENVVGLWHLDEGDGLFAWDFSETGANVEFEKEPEWLASSLTPSGDSGIRFDGNVLGTSSLEFDTTPLEIAQGKSLTIMAWIFPYNLYDSTDNIIMSLQGNISNVDYNWYIFINFTGNIVFASALLAGEIYTNSDQFSATSIGTVTENQWNHITITVDGGTLYDPSFQSGGNVNFYINGEPAGFDDMILDRGFRSSQQFTIGGLIVPSSLFGTKLYKYYGKISEISVHNVVRDINYIKQQVKSVDVLDEDNEVVGTLATGFSGDNGDRLSTLLYEIPDDYNFPGGKVRIVRKEKEPPSWEEDGTIIHQNNSVLPGITYVTDPDDFVHNENYYYRIFSQNTLGNYSFLTDSPSLQFVTPTSNDTFFPVLSPALPAPLDPDVGQLITPGNKKIFLRWDNNTGTDVRVLRTRIFYSPVTFPVVSTEGGSDGQLVFSGLLTENKFVHRELRNNEEAFYSIVNVDKYGRASPVLTARTVPSADADEGTIPLPEVANLHYELFNRNAVSLAWDQSVTKNPENINTFFYETVLIYASITDKFGIAISDESQVDLEVTPTVVRATSVDDVFGSGTDIAFDDKDTFNFLISKDDQGIIRGTLSITTNPAIVSQIESVSFVVRVKSIIPNPTGGDNLFEYISRSLNINFTNPWQIELVNRDNLKVFERCYFVDSGITDEGKEVKNLRIDSIAFDGIHIKKSSPFVARAKLTFKGEPILAGSIDVSVWDAEANICNCAGQDSCTYKGERLSVSETVLPPSNTLPIVRGFEEVLDADNNPVQSPISYVDIPLIAPDLQQTVLLYVKGTHASFSTIKDLYIVFQNILKIDINANSPRVDGKDAVEQQATAYLLNPDHPENKSLRTVPDNLTVVQWEILSIIGDTSRTIYSIDNVPIPNGVFSFLRNGTARNVFFGPIKGEEDEIEETHEIKATVVFDGLTSTARQFVTLGYSPKALPQFGARFLMEMEYSYKQARDNRLWTDGEDYVKLLISRDPKTSSTRHSVRFRDCAAEEAAPLLELNPAGQVVHLVSSIDEIEFIYDDVTEEVDPSFTGKRFITLGDDSVVFKKEAFVQLNSEEISDTTTVFIRINKFTPDAKGWKVDPECNETVEVNLDCLEINKCDLPGGDIFVEGTATLFINDEPFELQGGGDMETGVPPCPITFKEPLRFTIIFTKVDDVDTPFLGSFEDDEGETILKPSSSIDIRVEVSFAGEPVPNGTFVFLVISNADPGPTVFIGEQNIVTTFTEDDKSYADVRIIASRNPLKDITETAKIITRYNKIDEVSRELVKTFILNLKHEDFTLPPGDVVEDEQPSAVPAAEDFSIFSNTAYKYDIEGHRWEQIQSLSEGKGNSFGGVVNQRLYVMGGLKDNNFTISSRNEKYNISSDMWSLASPMVTSRFGGSSVVIGDDIYAIGGIEFNNDNQAIEVSRKVEVFHTNTNSWEELTSMPIIDEDTLDEVTYGVAYGTSQKVVIDNKDYIYILSGINEISISRGSPRIERYNDRILRYDVTNNSWETSRVLYSSELPAYTRLSPLSIIQDDNIVVFNGALNNEREYAFHVDIYTILLRSGINDFDFVEGGINFSTLPILKFQSSIVPVNVDSPSAGGDFYILGGANDDNGNLDTVELVSTIIDPFTYDISSDVDPSFNLVPMPVGKNGILSVFANVNGKDSIFVVGGYASGINSNNVIIDFDT
jgi:hypothetical protein